VAVEFRALHRRRGRLVVHAGLGSVSLQAVLVVGALVAGKRFGRVIAGELGLLVREATLVVVREF
jgi:hypothetical protein